MSMDCIIYFVSISARNSRSSGYDVYRVSQDKFYLKRRKYKDCSSEYTDKSFAHCMVPDWGNVHRATSEKGPYQVLNESNQVLMLMLVLPA
jgi:hypothetical protein